MSEDHKQDTTPHAAPSLPSKPHNGMMAGNKVTPIIPQTFEEVQRIAHMAVRSELFKPAKNGEEHEVTLARCVLCIMTGADVGLSPAQSVQSIAVINGRCLIYGAAVPGILWSKGFKIEQRIDGSGDDRTATCTITRPGGLQITRSFSVREAKRAKLWDERAKVKRRKQDGSWYEVDNDSPWHRFPDRMLGWRALGFAKADGASDAMHGLDLYENVIDLTSTEYSDVSEPAPRVIPAPPKRPQVADQAIAVADVGEAPDADKTVTAK